MEISLQRKGKNLQYKYSMRYVIWVFKDKSSWIVFLTVFILSLWGFKVIPQDEQGNITVIHALLGTLYAALFALITTCLFKTIKEKLIQSFRERNPLAFAKQTVNQWKEGQRVRALKTFASGVLKFTVFLLGVIGIGAAQFCVFGSPVCTVSVGAGIVMTIFPATVVQILYEYAKWIIAAAIVLQAIGLYLMGCFKRVPSYGVK